MKFLLAAISIFALTSCGGGGGGGAPAGGAPVASNFNGVAVDGYLYQARAFLDLNGNGQYDNGEPTAITDSNGGFTLSATQDQINSHSVVVSAIAGTTIDQDNPNTPLSSGMTLIAPAGNPSVVSPLTTQVAAKMSGGLSLAEAKSVVQTELGLANIDVMKNFVAEKATNAAYADAHKVATSVAEILKSIEAQSSLNTSLASKLTALSTRVTSQVVPNIAYLKASTSTEEAKSVVTDAIAAEVNIYSVGGTITGLSATGLVLTDGLSSTNPEVGANSFVFTRKKPTGAAYAVTVLSNPAGQVCTVSNGSGSISSQSVTNVSVSCSNSPGVLGGTISGLTSAGLILKNGADELTVPLGETSFKFSASVSDSSNFLVTVKTQPTGKTCSVANGSGVMTSAGVSNVQITCSANSYSLSGSISGLTASGLKLKNGSEILTISSGATTFAFNSSVAYGGAYAVTIDTQPVGVSCSLSNSSGTMGAANVTAVQVSCSANSYSVNANVTGLMANQTLSIYYSNNVRGGSSTSASVTSNGSVSLATNVPHNTYASVALTAVPSNGQSCFATFDYSSKTYGLSQVTSYITGDAVVDIVCAPLTYTALVSGLTLSSSQRLYYYNRGYGNIYVNFWAGQLGRWWQITYKYSQAGDTFKPTFIVNGTVQSSVSTYSVLGNAKFDPGDAYSISVTTDSAKTCAASIPTSGVMTSNLSFAINCN